MPTSTPFVTRRAGRRALASTAVLGLALSLTACTIGEGDDDEVIGSSPAAVAGTPSQQEPTTGAAPDVPVDQLVLNGQDAPELGLVAVSAEELSGGIDSLESITSGLRVEPEACADFSQDSLLAQAEPGVMAIQAGQSGDTQFAVAVTTLTAGVPDRDRLIDDCPVITVTFPIEGAEVSTVTQNSRLAVDAPEGVEDFAAVSQDSAMDMMGTEVRTGNVMITGVVDGIGVSVTATGAAGPISDGARDLALRTFVQQVEKVRSA